MGGRRCSEDEAFQILAQLSQDTTASSRDVAAALDEQPAPTDER
jgi:hypothetical protein